MKFTYEKYIQTMGAKESAVWEGREGAETALTGKTKIAVKSKRGKNKKIRNFFILS